MKQTLEEEHSEEQAAVQASSDVLVSYYRFVKTPFKQSLCILPVLLAELQVMHTQALFSNVRAHAYTHMETRALK